MDINLRKITNADFKEYFQLINNKHVITMLNEEYKSWHQVKKEYIQRLINNNIDKDLGTFRISDTEKDSLLGFAKLEAESSKSVELEVGYIILPMYWNKGIASIVCKRLIEIAKKKTKIQNLYAFVITKNVASKRVLLKNGFKNKQSINENGKDEERFELQLHP